VQFGSVKLVNGRVSGRLVGFPSAEKFSLTCDFLDIPLLLFLNISVPFPKLISFRDFHQVLSIIPNPGANSLLQ
jgi:hypothetical protein